MARGGVKEIIKSEREKLKECKWISQRKVREMEIKNIRVYNMQREAEQSEGTYDMSSLWRDLLYVWDTEEWNNFKVKITCEVKVLHLKMAGENS